MGEYDKTAEPAAFARVREMCFADSGVTETKSWGHPSFRVGRKTFVTLALLQEAQFLVTPYGRGQWVSRYADGRPPWRLIRNLIDESYHLAVPSKNRRGKS